MGEVSFRRKLLFLSLAFLQIQLQSLSLDLHEAQMLRPEGMNISDDPWISEMEKSIVDGDAAGGRRVEDGEFRVLNSSPKEIGNGVCSSMKRDDVERGVL